MSNEPVVRVIDGSKRWYLNGELHRTDGPAIEYLGGSKFWFLNGKLHCVDGPAIELSDGTKRWYLDGVEYTEYEYNFQIMMRYAHVE